MYNMYVCPLPISRTVHLNDLQLTGVLLSLKEVQYECEVF